jgi:hypothetical protein
MKLVVFSPLRSRFVTFIEALETFEYKWNVFKLIFVRVLIHFIFLSALFFCRFFFYQIFLSSNTCQIYVIKYTRALLMPTRPPCPTGLPAPLNWMNRRWTEGAHNYCVHLQISLLLHGEWKRTLRMYFICNYEVCCLNPWKSLAVEFDAFQLFYLNVTSTFRRILL